MRTWSLVATLAFMCTPALAFADDTSILEKAAVFDPTVHFGEVGAITFEPMLQARWTSTASGGPEANTVTGFSVPRARLVVTASVYDAVSFRLRIGSSSNGDATFQQAYAQVIWKTLRVRAGQLPLNLNSGEEPAAQRLSTTDFSSYSNAFAGGQTQGIELAYDGPVRLFATVGNGARSGFSELLSPIAADLATTGRVELPIGNQPMTAYLSETSFRKHQKTTARIGATGHFQMKGSTSTNPANNIELVSGDIGVRGSGFSVLASATYLELAQTGMPTVQNAGLMVFGSVFPARRVELFGQFDAIWPLGDHAPYPPGVANGQSGTTLFRTMTVGASYFIVPDAHRCKIQVDMQTMFDAERTSIVPPNSALGVLSTTGPQVTARVQLVVSL